MIQNETSWSSIDNQLSFFAVTFNTASHQAIVILSIQKELPESIFTTIMLFNHFVWEASSLFISDQNLLRLETCQFLDAFVNISTYQISIASVHLSISFFDESDPHFVWISACSENWLSGFDIDRDSLINNDINPLEVFENSNNEETLRSEPMKDWWINTI